MVKFYLAVLGLTNRECNHAHPSKGVTSLRSVRFQYICIARTQLGEGRSGLFGLFPVRYTGQLLVTISLLTVLPLANGAAGPFVEIAGPVMAPGERGGALPCLPGQILRLVRFSTNTIPTTREIVVLQTLSLPVKVNVQSLHPRNLTLSLMNVPAHVMKKTTMIQRSFILRSQSF